MKIDAYVYSISLNSDESMAVIDITPKNKLAIGSLRFEVPIAEADQFFVGQKVLLEVRYEMPRVS